MELPAGTSRAVASMAEAVEKERQVFTHYNPEPQELKFFTDGMGLKRR
jgi:hypothetical protein